MIDDPYKILGVSPDASDDEIKRAYRRLAKKYHPDINPGDETAAKKMQEINAAYEQIKNPEKARQNAGQSSYGGYGSAYGPFGGYGGAYGPFGGYGGSAGYGETGYQQQDQDNYQKAAYNYIQYHRYQEALNALQNSTNRNARWYYLSAMANDGLGNQVTALEHIRKAVSMDPSNPEYTEALDQMEHGGAAYRRQAGNFQGFGMSGNLCHDLCMCYMFNLCCCNGRICCC